MKKISWWESKYSDYTHYEVTEEHVTLYLKPNVELSKIRNTERFLSLAEEMGCLLVLVHNGSRYVLIRYDAYNKMMKEVMDDVRYA